MGEEERKEEWLCHLSTNERRPGELSLAGLAGSRPITRVACLARRRRSTGEKMKEQWHSISSSRGLNDSQSYFRRVIGEKRKGGRKRLRSSGIHSHHFEGLTGPPPPQ